MLTTTTEDIIRRILNHTDNYEPITKEWLMIVTMLPGDETSPPEHETTIQCVDTRTNTQLHADNGEEWEEVTVLGYNLETRELYIECYGGPIPMSTQTQDLITLPPISTRLELRLLLLAHKAWGYRGE